MVLDKDFKEFIESLNANKVKYLIVGGYAVALHGYPPNRIDLVMSCDGVDFESCYSSRIEYLSDNIKMNFIDLENLRKNKKKSGRPQDLADLDNLQLKK